MMKDKVFMQHSKNKYDEIDTNTLGIGSCIYRRKDYRLIVWNNRCMGGWIDRYMYVWMDGWLDG